MRTHVAKFYVGQLINHKLFKYRGVIYDVDPDFQGTDEWYERVALSRPPKDEPWYRVLVDNAVHETYVAERNLQADGSNKTISHPLLESFFDVFEDGHYKKVEMSN